MYLLLSVSLKGINLSWSKVQVNKVMYIYQKKFLPAKVASMLQKIEFFEIYCKVIFLTVVVNSAVNQ